MDQTEALKLAFRVEPTPSRRERRAASTRDEAFSPLRVLLGLLVTPLLVASLTVSIYIYTSPYTPPNALRHLIALIGCDAAAKVGVAPAFIGEIGYHPLNDIDGNGVACGSHRTAAKLPINVDRISAIAPATGG